MFPALFLLFGFGAGGGEEGCDKNVIHIASTQKTPVFTTFSPLLYNALRKDLEQDTLSQAPMLFATMPNCTGIYRVFAS